MKIKELEPFLPKYSDGSGYDVKIRYNTSKWGGPWCDSDLYQPKTKPGQRELTIKLLTAGCLGFGGNYDDIFTIYVEESEVVPEDTELVKIEKEKARLKYEKEEEQRRLKKQQEERKTYEQLKRKYENKGGK